MLINDELKRVMEEHREKENELLNSMTEEEKEKYLIEQEKDGVVSPLICNGIADITK